MRTLSKSKLLAFWQCPKRLWLEVRHPRQQGSWGIKAVLPTLCPDLSYTGLEGVQDGGMAMAAFLEAIAPQTATARKAEIERQLLAYCALDTYALVRLWAEFTGRSLKV